MIIGIYLSYGTKYVGGGHVYQKCLFEDIVDKQKTTFSGHKIIFFYHGENELIKNRPGIFVDTSWYNGGLNEAAMRHKVDLVWFLSIATVDIDIPHILPVWDLQHRLQPFFPEVSSGGEYLKRDKSYSHFLPRATYVLTGTEEGKKEISFFYRIPVERIIVNPLPLPQYMGNESVAMPEELEPHGLVKNRFIFYPAQFWPHKNHIVLLETLKILKTRHNLDYKLVLTGSDHGNMGYVLDKVSQMGLEGDVFSLGFVSTQSILWLYQNSFALVYPSFFGPDNIPPIEAFAVGCPVIAAEVNGAKDQLVDAAILVDPRDENAFVSAILRLAEEPQLRESLIQKGYNIAGTRTAEIYVQTVFKLIDNFASTRRCWDAHFGLNYTPDMVEWLNRYVQNREIHSLTTLLSSCKDKFLRDSFDSLQSTLDGIIAANQEAEHAISRREYSAAFEMLRVLIKECADYAPAYLNLAKIHYSRSELDTALELIQKANFYESRMKTYL